MRVAADIGYGHTKILADMGGNGGGDNGTGAGAGGGSVGRYEFPSIVTPWTDDGLVADAPRGVLGIEGKQVIAGRQSQGGKPLVSDDFHGGFEWRALLANAMHQVCLDTGKSVIEVERLGLGLPYSQNRPEMRQRVGSIKDLSFSVDGQPFHAIIGDTTVLPQGAAVLADFDGESVGVIDIGFYTVDLVLMRDGDIVNAASWSAQEGVHTIYKSLDRLLNARVGRSGLPFETLRRVLDSWQIRLGGQVVDLSEDVQKILNDYAARVQAIARDQWGTSIDLLERIVVAGGGAEMLRGRLPTLYEIHADPQFANAHGYLAAITAD